MDITITDGCINLGGKSYPVNLEVPVPDVVGFATDPITGRQVGITATGKECLEYLQAALGVNDVALEPGATAWASEFMCTSVSILLEGLQLGNLLVQAP